MFCWLLWWWRPAQGADTPADLAGAAAMRTPWPTTEGRWQETHPAELPVEVPEELTGLDSMAATVRKALDARDQAEARLRTADGIIRSVLACHARRGKEWHASDSRGFATVLSDAEAWTEGR